MIKGNMDLPVYFSTWTSLQAATLKIVVGSHIWLEDKHSAWIDGEVFRIEGQNAHVHATNGKTVRLSCVAC